MRKYQERIADHSLWLTATPTFIGQTLPFYITEAGHFFAEHEYLVERKHHDSFLFLYTITGLSEVVTGKTTLTLPAQHGIVIDCHRYHRYASADDSWEFLWIHLKGNAIDALHKILYSNAPSAIKITNPLDFYQAVINLINGTEKNDLASSLDQSAAIHKLFNLLINTGQENEVEQRRRGYNADIEHALEFIRQNYNKPITVDDMISSLHISKYHFIRLFRRTMGTTPYSYLMNYRINTAKRFLRSTDWSIAIIAEKCGFLDPSNFIAQFKKRTEQKPTEYRRDFYVG